jgi:hypothetical protein
MNRFSGAIALALATQTMINAYGFTDTEARCYSIVTSDHSQRTPYQQPTRSAWCYMPTEVDGQSSVLIFKPQNDRVAAELSAVVFLDDELKPKTIQTGFLNAGERHVISAPWAGFSPLGIPIDETELSLVDATQIIFSERLANSVRDLLNWHMEQGTDRSFVWKIEPGIFEHHIPTENKPFGAFWWDMADYQLGAGPYSPLGKYDAHVQSISGVNPDSVAWEKQYHSLNSVPWGGHCNGWAASSILYKKPQDYRWDAASKRVIFPSDMDGMLAESSFCVDMAFYGYRYWNSSSDAKDIHPDLFHKVLMYYIQGQNKAVAVDYYPDDSVDNNIISGYRFEITAVEGEPQKFKVSAEIAMHDYLHSRSESATQSSNYTRRYQYFLSLDDQGNIASGEWISNNPDFLWVPLAQKKCAGENPKLEHSIVENLIKHLPIATQRDLATDVEINVTVNPGETLPIMSGLHGAYFELSFAEVQTDGDIQLLLMGAPIHPRRGNETDLTETHHLGTIAQSNLRLQAQGELRAKLHNRGTEAANVRMHIRKISALSGI